VPDRSSFRIELRVPGETEHLRAPRLVAASTATMLGYDLDDLWEVRYGVDELCSALMTLGCPRLDIVFEEDPPSGCLVVRGSGDRRPSTNGNAPEGLGEYAVAILDAVTAAWAMENAGTTVCFTATFRPPALPIARSDEISLPH
jgi:hypothetical protein